MRTLATALLLASVLTAQDPTPGQTFDFPWEPVGEALPVFVPTDYDREAPPPVFLYYPGTDGFATPGPIPEATAGKGWVVVGAQYVQRGLLRPSAEGVRAEWANLQAIVAALGQRLPIDASRIYVGGFSKGGWTACLFARHMPGEIRGAFVGGGGLALGADLPVPAAKDLPVYVGVGETDPNRIASLQAIEAFEKQKAAVTYDEYPGIGHSYAISDAMRAWFEVERLRAGDGDATARADEALSALVAAAPPRGIEGYLELVAAEHGPWFAWASPGARKAVSAAAADLRKSPELKAEIAAEKAYDRALSTEIDQRGKPIRARTVAAAQQKQIQQKQKLLRQYEAITEKHPETHFGRKAVADAERIREHLTLLEREAGR